MKMVFVFTYATIALCSGPATQADTFGSGANAFDIDFAIIGNPGNAGDTTGDPSPAGKVDYAYRLGQFAVSEDMINKANHEAGLGLTHDNRGPNKPATSISWFEAARFVNWLNTSTDHTPAYNFDSNGVFQLWQPSDMGYNPSNRYRNSRAVYVLSTIDEWYKAAYYDPDKKIYYDYSTGSDSFPTAVARGTAHGTSVYSQTFAQGPADVNLSGGLSPYGTMGQSGNIWEWNETALDSVNDLPTKDRSVRGGNWNGRVFTISSSDPGDDVPWSNDSRIGLRVASLVVPESTNAALALVALLLAVGRRGCR